MSDVKFTPEQLRVINGRGKNMIVSASAGSGKTTVMIRRVISLIEEGASLADMVICTFTKASAADMRAKLYKELKTLSETDKRFNAELAILPQAQISTIHSFCGQLIKTYFYAVDVDPDFKIATEAETTAMLVGCIESTIEKYLRAGDKDFLALYEIMLKNRGASKLAALVKRVYDFAACQADFDAWLDGCLNSSLRRDEHIKFIKDAYSPDFGQYEKSAEELLEKTAEAGFTRNLPACEELVQAVKRRVKSELSPSGRKPTDGYLLDLNDEFAALKSDYNKFVKKFNEVDNLPDAEKTLPLARVLVSLTRDSAQSFAAAKKKKAVLDYSDLEHYASVILGNPETRAAANDKYKYVFVDEYQDVNPLQEKLISLLSARKFYVGDVKQSIYAFRMCDSSIFLKKYDAYSYGAGDAVNLNSNFRSDKTILSFCNDVFSDIMTPDFGRVDYALSAFFPLPDDCAKTGNAVSAAFVVSDKKAPPAEPKIYSVKEHVNPVNETDLYDAETALIAARIERLLADGDNAPSDIAVLLRAMRGRYVKILTRKLAERNIPYFVSDTRAATENPDVNALICVLKFINNHSDDIALCSVMRSYFGAFTDDEIAEIREWDDKRKISRAGERFFYLAAADYANADGGSPKADKSLQAKLKNFYGKFERYTLLSSAVKVSRLLGVICAENDYFRYVYSKSGGEVSARELARFLDIAESAAYDGSVDTFLKSIERESPMLEAAPPTDAVRIMTVHASKGLEFKHVILGRIGKKFDKRELSGSVLLGADSGLSLKCFDADEKTASDTCLHVRMKLEKEHRLKEEEMRILYVALTRAKNTLFICGSAKKLPETKQRADKAESCFDWLYPHVKEFAQIYDTDDCARLAESCSVAVRPTENVYSAALKDEIRRYIAPQAQAKRVPHKVTVTALAHTAADENEAPAAKAVFADDERGAEIGSAYHLIMQNADFGAPFDSEWERLEAAFPNECALVNRKAIKTAVSKMETFLSGIGVSKMETFTKDACVSDLETFAKDVRVYRELPFIVNLSAEIAGADGNGDILVQGIIDFLVETGDGYIVVDYKTGEIDAQRLISYEKQISLYARAVEKLLKKPVLKKYIYSFSSSSFTEIQSETVKKRHFF